MAIRCFARRNLVAPYRYASRGLGQSSASQNAIRSLTTSQASFAQHADEQKERVPRVSKKGGVRIGDDQDSPRGFFSSRWQDLPITSGESSSSISERHQRQIKESDTIPHHPLVHDLMYELQSHEARPSPELVWRLYNAIEMTKLSSIQLIDDQTSSAQLSLIMPIHVHKRVLRAISPSLGTSKDKKTIASAAEVQQYLSRVNVIFDNLRRQSAGATPTAADFDKVFREIVQSGNMTSILALWSAMTGSSSQVLERSNAKRARQRKNANAINAQMTAFNVIEPTRETYSNLMLGIYRHLQDQLKRALKSDLDSSKDLNYGQQRRQRLAATREGEFSQSMKRAMTSRSPFEHLNPRAQQALVLASERTSHLLRDMLERDIPLTRLACNLAMRVMRITGNLDAMKALTTLAFGVDLDNLDGSVAQSAKGNRNVPTHFHGKPDVYLLNTVIQALGEQSTVGKMVAAYETLTRPLPRSIKADTPIPEGSLFATDFRGLLSWSDPAEADLTASDTNANQPNEDSATLNITPNTATMIHLVRNACKHPPPQQMMMYISRTTDQQLGQMKEYEARQKGVYGNLALYFVREAVSVQEEDLKKMARGLGFDQKYVEEMISYFTSQLQSLGVDSFSGLPSVDDENFMTEYVDRLLYLSKESRLKAEGILASLARALPIEETEIMSDEQKLAVQAANRAAEEAYAARQKSAREFLGGIQNVPAPAFNGSAAPQSFKRIDIGVTPEVIMPLITMAKQTRTGGILRDVGEWLERSMALYICEIRLLNVSMASQKAASHASSKSPSLHPFVTQMNERIEELHAVVRKNAELYVSQVRRQLVQFSGKRRERFYRRKTARKQAKVAALAEAQEKKREKAARRLRLSEEKAADAEGVAENVDQARQNVVSA
ncbi:uncharacterized protein FA14DRAFT_59083 [Meira miltonrushii]|uniref:Uncharacterized protein n=1 Tax=Meira miltonrushii TaxID=1280837 RepID=A0A316V6M6_9BASI|nr:uncharacterized protein FA14DRAFT_59083 [Meira miltonrushii]PWN33180.1 hypothetical protein FA14DRAFT_59083 [Meira miltonrushii]